MSHEEMLRIARKAIYKKWDFETLKYGDDLYGHSDLADDLWDLVEECEEIGTKAFNEKYPIVNN